MSAATWNVVSSQILLSNPWLTLRADACVTAAGAKIDPYYVLAFPDWVHVVAVTKDDCLIMVRQYRHAAGAACLELPGGHVDAADAGPEDAAKRELLEETGYRAGGLRRVATLHVNAASHTNLLHTCVATDLRLDADRILEAGEEGMTVELVPLSDILLPATVALVNQSMHVSSLLLGLAALGRINLEPPR